MRRCPARPLVPERAETHPASEIADKTSFHTVSSARQGFYKGRDFYRREIRKRIRDRIRQNDLIAVAHRAAGIDDVGHITFALGRLGTD